MTEKYLIMISVYLSLILAGLYFKSKRLKRELDKANIQNSKLSKALDIRRQEPLFGNEYDVKTVGYQTEIDDRDYRRMNLPAEVLEMEQEKRAIYEIVEEIQRIGGVMKYEEGDNPYTPNRRVIYELKFLLKK